MVQTIRIPFGQGRVCRRVLALFGIALLALTASAADELVQIDFRNKIPGILDAPVYGFDGVTRLASGRFSALL